MINPTENFTNEVNNIVITSLSTGKTTTFKSFITSFSDDYNSNWNSQEIYGRMDPVYTFKNTIRKINISFDVPSYDVSEANKNLSNSNELIKALYPVYDNTSGLGTRLLAAPPLVRIKLANLIQKTNGDALLGWIAGYSFKPEMESGVFVDGNNIVPKLFKVNFTFNVIHEDALGTDTKICDPSTLPTRTEFNETPRNRREARQQIATQVIVENGRQVNKKVCMDPLEGNRPNLTEGIFPTPRKNK